jgi:N-acetylglucosamine kinase-like BadF-type ATPase
MEQSLLGAMDAAFAAAGLKREPVVAACLGLAGADRPADQQVLSEWCDKLQLAAHVSVVNDGRLVMAAGTPSDWGVAVIAGTGSFALARSRDGQMRRAGGWGYLFGDEGSAYAIALAALKAVTQAYDGSGPATALTERVLEWMQIGDVKSVVPAIYGSGQTRSEIARLAEVVTAAAEAGDAVALGCLDRAASELATTARAAARLLTDACHDAIPVALAGSLLIGCRLYADQILKNFSDGLRVELSPVTFVAEPATGAIKLAGMLVRSNA